MKDPIVEEVRQARRKLFEKCGCDLDKLMDYVEERQKEHGDLLVTQKDLEKRKKQLAGA